MSSDNTVSEIVETEGHLIDSRLMTEIFDAVVKHGGSFEVVEFTIGRTNDDFSRLQMRVTAPAADVMQGLLEELLTFGCRIAGEIDAALQPAPIDGCAPDDFYSTSNHHTWVRHGGQWIEVERQRMDAAVVIDDGRAICRKLRDLRAGDQVVCSLDGIRVVPEFRERDRHGFAFMTGGISSERHVETSVERIADMIRDVKRAGGRIAFVVGPVVVHTGAAAYFCDIIRRGYVDVLLAGNALAVHDIEGALYGTSLGVSLKTGAPVEGGHRHHMRAINTIRRAGGIRAAVASGQLTSGIMYECVRHDVPFVLAGQHPRRRAAARHDHGSRRGAGSLCRGARRRRDRRRAVDHAARDRRGQHAAVVGQGRLRRHQPVRGHEAGRSGLGADDGAGDRYGPVRASAGAAVC